MQKAHDIADRENLRMIWDTQVFADQDAPLAIHFRVQLTRQRGSRISCGPDNGSRPDCPISEVHPFCCDICNIRPDKDLHFHLL